MDKPAPWSLLGFFQEFLLTSVLLDKAALQNVVTILQFFLCQPEQPESTDINVKCALLCLPLGSGPLPTGKGSCTGSVISAVLSQDCLPAFNRQHVSLTVSEVSVLSLFIVLSSVSSLLSVQSPHGPPFKLITFLSSVSSLSLDQSHHSP